MAAATLGSPSLVGAGLKAIYVGPCPEPSSLGLGILGIGALFLLRRRK
jgi:MYXO-CTERM domain-containing protein